MSDSSGITVEVRGDEIVVRVPRKQFTCLLCGKVERVGAQVASGALAHNQSGRSLLMLAEWYPRGWHWINSEQAAVCEDCGAPSAAAEVAAQKLRDDAEEQLKAAIYSRRQNR